MQPVAPEQLANEWPRVAAWIESALAYGQGDENALDILISIARGHYILWVEPGKCAAVGQIIRHPRQTVLTILYVGGEEIQTMKRCYDLIKEWARANRIDVVRVWGRPGWERALDIDRIGVILQERI